MNAIIRTMTMDRAYSLLTVKAVEEDKRIIRGVATTPEPDRVGDIVEPLGVKFKNPMPLLLYHQSDKPVGHVKFDKPTKSGITFEATIPGLSEPGTLKDRLDEAWQSVKAGLIAGVSIGFRALEWSRLDDGGIRFIETEVLELSLVTVPANAGATIQTIKSIDRAAVDIVTGAQSGFTTTQAASGLATNQPGVSGKSTTIPKTKGQTNMKKTIAEQISAFEATRQAKAARMDEIMDKAADEGVTLDAEQTEEYDGLVAEMKGIDAHLVRLAALERSNAARAKPVTGADTAERASEVRGGGVISVTRNLPKGTAFTRYAIALARSKGNLMQAVEVSKAWHDSTPEVETVLRAAVAAGTTTDPTWAAPLVQYQVMASEFIELLRPATIIGNIPGLRRVPFNISMPAQTSGSSVGWVGEGSPKPVSKLAFETTTLRWAKAAGIVVLTDELVRFSNPSAEAIVRQDLIAAMAQFLDNDFVDPAKAAVANVSPASITNGITPVEATGTDIDALKADVKALFSAFLTANLSPAGATWIMRPTTALSIGMMMNPLGQPEFPQLGINGGTFFGLPVVLSENVPADTTSPTEAIIILVKPSEIMLADDGGVTIDVSREASLQMDDAPDSPSSASTVMISLWQRNMIALRAERFINWKRRRDDAVGYIAGANYG